MTLKVILVKFVKLYNIIWTLYLGRKIAIDASMSLYQFLIAVRQDGQVLMTESGETTRSMAKLIFVLINAHLTVT